MQHDPLAVLDPAQRAAAKLRKLPRRKLGRGVLALLILLRVYVVVAIPIVGYAFVHAVMATPQQPHPGPLPGERVKAG